MATPQQKADCLLARWQQIRALPPAQRIEVIRREFFDPPLDDDDYQEVMERVAAEMERRS